MVDYLQDRPADYSGDTAIANVNDYLDKASSIEASQRKKEFDETIWPNLLRGWGSSRMRETSVLGDIENKATTGFMDTEAQANADLLKQKGQNALTGAEWQRQDVQRQQDYVERQRRQAWEDWWKRQALTTENEQNSASQKSSFWKTILGTAGTLAGSIFGPAGAAVGSGLGNLAGDALSGKNLASQSNNQYGLSLFNEPGGSSSLPPNYGLDLSSPSPTRLQ
jgi:hypothetical protein